MAFRRMAAVAALTQGACATAGRMPRLAGTAAAGEQCAEHVGFIHLSKCGGTGMLVTLEDCCGLQRLQRVKQVASPPRPPYSFWFHSSALEQRAVVGASIWNKAYTFALVRNPWDRQLSRFWFHAEKACLGTRMDTYNACKHHKFHRDIAPADLGPREFQTWVRILHEHYPPGCGRREQYWVNSRSDFVNEQWEYFGAAQWYWLTDPQGRVLVNDWYKLEELESNWHRLQQRVCGLAGTTYKMHSLRGRGVCSGIHGCPEGETEKDSLHPPRRRQDFYDNETRWILETHMKLDVDNLKYSFD
eukprot:TRINITY_DN9232_c2_g1_i1.p1 TRINITY_DN9232_c2_g1~~TRINITY_DN9232_c2_g1_i1.p1  ORF type:complete len:302 (+),score=47.10 TRINITY_DN9232_c2_g1_i1:112-1017(+)